MGNTILFNTAGSIALAINYETQGPYNDKFATRQAATTVRLNAELFVRVDDAVFCIEDDVDLTEADLDTGSNFDVSDTYYLYACQPLDGTQAPVFKISKNATYPAGGWDGDTSRKIGGFETDGAGDITVGTLWDLRTQDTTLVSSATTATEGLVELATNSEAAAGSETDKALVPGNLASILQAIGALAGDDLDFNGEYAVGLQNITDLTAGGPGYWFDGGNDTITVPENANFKPTQGITIFAKVYPTDFKDGVEIVQNMTWATDGWVLRLSSSGTFSLAYIDPSVGVWQTIGQGSLLELNQWSMVAASVDTSDGTAIAYLNGLAGTPDTKSVAFPDGGTADLIIAGDLNYDRFGGSISDVKIFNLTLSAAEVKALSAGGPVPHKYIGASQDEIIADVNDRTFAAASNWRNVSMNTYNETGDLTVSSTAAIQHCVLDAEFAPMERGKVYRISIIGSALSGDSFSLREAAGSYNIIAALVDGLNTVEYEIPTTGGIRIRANGTGSITLDDVSITQIGCVLQLEQDGIGNGQWIDKSGNELHGTVFGAIPTNLPIDHTEKYIDLTVTGDTSFTLPAGYLISSITTKETAGNSVGGGIDIGTTNGGGEIVAAHAVTASTVALCALVAGANYNITGADDTIYITDADGTGWDSASVEIRVQMQRIDM